MIIILEGPDNAGKSTLGNMLSVDLGISLVHPGGPPKNIVEVINRCYEQANTFSLSSEVDFIYDRVTCISDMIYRGKPEYNKMFTVFHYQLKLMKNVVIIYCRPSDERVKNFDDHIQKDHEDASVVQHAKDNVDRIVSEYDAFMNSIMYNLNYTVLRYDFERDASKESYNALVRLLTSRMDCK